MNTFSLPLFHWRGGGHTFVETWFCVREQWIPLFYLYLFSTTFYIVLWNGHNTDTICIHNWQHIVGIKQMHTTFLFHLIVQYFVHIYKQRLLTIWTSLISLYSFNAGLFCYFILVTSIFAFWYRHSLQTHHNFDNLGG